MKNHGLRRWFCAATILFLLLGAGHAVFAQEPGDTKESSVTIPLGSGTQTTTIATNETVDIVTVVIKNRDGVVISNVSTTYFKMAGKEKLEVVRQFDCKGELTFFRQTSYDEFGKERVQIVEHYRDGVRLSGVKVNTNENGKKTTERYNTTTEKYEESALDPGPTSNEISVPTPDTEGCSIAVFQPNEIFGGFSVIREDSDPDRFNTFGVDTSYTRFVTEQFGVRASFNAHFSDQGGVELRKISVLGGVKVLPFKQATTEDRVTIFTNALFGVSHFSADSSLTRFTDNSFTMKIGGGLDVNLNNNFFIRPVQVDYAPTFFGSATQHNVQFSFGAGLRFGK